jgi:hypothetical protein
MGVTLLTSGILDDCLQSHNLFWDLPWGKKTNGYAMNMRVAGYVFAAG